MILQAIVSFLTMLLPAFTHPCYSTSYQTRCGNMAIPTTVNTSGFCPLSWTALHSCLCPHSLSFKERKEEYLHSSSNAASFLIQKAFIRSPAPPSLFLWLLGLLDHDLVGTNLLGEVCRIVCSCSSAPAIPTSCTHGFPCSGQCSSSISFPSLSHQFICYPSVVSALKTVHDCNLIFPRHTLNLKQMNSRKFASK